MGSLRSSVGRYHSLLAVLASPVFALAAAPLSPTRPHRNRSLTPPQPRQSSSALLRTTDSLARASRARWALEGARHRTDLFIYKRSPLLLTIS